MTKINVGDVVQLKSGGPKMTVASVDDEEIRCYWYVGGSEGYDAESFPSIVLAKIETMRKNKNE